MTDPYSSQCQERSRHCTFPTESRRGMRGPRTGGGAIEEDADFDEELLTPSAAAPFGNMRPKKRGRPNALPANEPEMENQDGEVGPSKELPKASDPIALWVPRLVDTPPTEPAVYDQLSYIMPAEYHSDSTHMQQVCPFATGYGNSFR